MFNIFKKEIRSFFNSSVGYAIMVLFSVGMGMFMWAFPPTVFDLGVADMSLLFDTAPYVFMFLIPAITMRLFSEELKSGTMELLLTKPISTWSMVLGKYFAGLALVLLALLPTLISYFSIYALGSPVGNIDSSAVFGSYIGLVFLAMAFTAIGLLSSSMFDNQIGAFVVALFMSFLFHNWFGFIADFFESDSNAFFIRTMGFSYHYDAVSRGVLDSRNLIYFLTMTAGFIFVTRSLVESRK
jgi:ABC-2 type transport system permease protein